MRKKAKPNIVSVTKQDSEYGIYRVTFNRKIKSRIAGASIAKGKGYYLTNVTDELQAYNKANELIEAGEIL